MSINYKLLLIFCRTVLGRKTRNLLLVSFPLWTESTALRKGLRSNFGGLAGFAGAGPRDSAEGRSLTLGHLLPGLSDHFPALGWQTGRSSSAQEKQKDRQQFALI